MVIKMSSHRKVHSQGSIPFSWEDMPGVSKTPNHDYYYPINIVSFDANKQEQSMDSSRRIPAFQVQMKIPPPPCRSQPPSRSTSGKGFRWQEDPFLVAYKECTKSRGENASKKGGGFNSTVRKSRSIFSCKSSSVTDVMEDNFLKLSGLPRLPRDRSHCSSNSSAAKQKLKLNYDDWL